MSRSLKSFTARAYLVEHVDCRSPSIQMQELQITCRDGQAQMHCVTVNLHTVWNSKKGRGDERSKSATIVKFQIQLVVVKITSR